MKLPQQPVGQPPQQIRDMERERGRLGTIGGKPAFLHARVPEVFPHAAGQHDLFRILRLLHPARQQSQESGVVTARSAHGRHDFRRIQIGHGAPHRDVLSEGFKPAGRDLLTLIQDRTDGLENAAFAA